VNFHGQQILRWWVDRVISWVSEITVSVMSWCMDTSDPRQFVPKTVRHYIFGTEMSYFFVSVLPKCLWDTSALRCRSVSTFYEGAEVSNGHFGTSAEVSRTDRRRVHVLVSLHHLTSHLHHPSRSSDSVSRHFVYMISYRDIRIWLLNIT